MKNLPFVALWMDLEGIMLSEIIQTEKDKYSRLSLICRILKNKQMDITKQKQIHRYRKQNSCYQWGERRGEGQDRGMRLRDTNYYV